MTSWCEIHQCPAGDCGHMHADGDDVDTRSIAVRAKVHADQLDTEINALREKVGALEAMVAAIQKMMPRQHDMPSPYDLSRH